MHAPETAAVLGQDVPGTVVRPFSGPLDRGTNQPQGIVAYHGTPHDFDRFSSEHIGAGEGAQTYGHGLYFAENEGVARGYRDALTLQQNPDIHTGAQFMWQQVAGHLKHNPQLSDADLRGMLGIGFPDESRASIDQAIGFGRKYTAQTAASGHLYQVRLNRDPEHFLDWEQSLEAQSPHVREALSKLPVRMPDMTRVEQQPDGSFSVMSRRGEEIGGFATAPEAQEIANEFNDRKAQSFDGGAIYRQLGDGPSDASHLLNEAGIAGIRYLDAGSRGAGDGSRNYVTFNDHDIQVTHKNGVPLARPLSLPDYLKGEARGAFVKELAEAGMSPTSFSTDLKSRAEKLLKSGERIDHGRALEQAHIGQSVPEDIANAVDGGAAQRSRTAVPGTSREYDRFRGENSPAANGIRRGSLGEAGGAPREGLTPNIDQGAADRLTAAKAAFAEFKQIHDNPIVRGALETNGRVGQYKMPDSAIPAKWIVPGDKGFEVANAFLRASGGDPRAIAAMQDASLMPLRKGALTNGTIHPNALARWKAPDAYGGALRALDGVSPGFSSRFDNAARATQAVLDAGIEHQQQLKAFQQEAAARALSENAASKAAMNQGLASIKAQQNVARNSAPGKYAQAAGNAVAPTEVENVVGGMLKTGKSGASRMREMVQSVQADPDALEGLRKAGVDWMVRTHLAAGEAGASGEKQIKGAQLINFLIANRDTLKELYTHPQMSMFGAIARSIETDSKWIAATTAKNGPGTAKDLAPKISQATMDNAKHVSMGVVAMEGLRESFERGGWTGAAIAAATPAAYLLNVLRGAGIKRVDTLYQQMLLDPELAKLMISKMPENLEGSKWHSLTRAVRRALITAPLAQRAAATNQRHQQAMSTGR